MDAFLEQFFGISLGGRAFVTPALLLLALFILPLIWQQKMKGRDKRAGAKWPSAMPLKIAKKGRFSQLKHVPLTCRCLALILLAIAAARPQGGPETTKRKTDGLDIVLVIDTSRSMEARDFILNGERPTRLEVIKSVIGSFVAERPSDRIGLVVFGTAAFTQAPLTLDHEVLQRFIKRIKVGVAGDATAIGDGLATAVARLKDVEAKSKIAILLTDGSNNAGRIDPMAAAEAAKTLGVKVYSVGVGSEGEVPIVIDGRMTRQRVDIDEDGLKAISSATGGRYFRATDTETLVKIYDAIDKLEKSKLPRDDAQDREERFFIFAALALGLVFIEVLWSITRFRRIP